LPPFVVGHDGGTLFLGKVPEEDEHEAVAFLDRIRVDARPFRYPVEGTQRGNPFAAPLAVELPAVVRALDAAVDHLAVTERAAAVGTGVVDTTRAAFPVAPEHEIETEHPHLQRRVGE